MSNNVQNAGADLRRIIAKYGHNNGLDIEKGTVIATTPLTVLMDGSDIVLQKDDLSVAQNLVARSETLKIDGVSRVIEYNGLEQTDRVALIYDADRSVYFVFAKVADGEDY